MSLDEKYEQALYDALENVARMPWPHERARIFKNAMAGIMRCMNWPSVVLHQAGIEPAGLPAERNHPDDR